MHDHIAEVDDLPSVAGQTLLFTLALVLLADVLQNCVGQRVQHAVACASADHEIIGKGYHVLEFQEYDVFPFLVFQSIDDLTSQV